MQANRIGAGYNAAPNLADDLRSQRAVLTHVLALHPVTQTIPSLVRELVAGSEEGDDIERAIRDLTGIGLLDCPCGLVSPSRQALHFDLLMSS